MNEQTGTGGSGGYVPSIVRPTPVTILCPECGEMVEVHDIHAVLLALHLQNECTLSSLFHAHRDDG